jgi:hypothetical protein
METIEALLTIITMAAMILIILMILDGAFSPSTDGRGTLGIGSDLDRDVESSHRADEISGD